MDNLTLASALSSLKTLVDLAKAGLDARNDAQVRAAIAEFASKLADANLKALDMSERLLELQTELSDANAQLRSAKQRESERASYVLEEITPGTLVYAFKPLGDDPTPAHYLCQLCHDAGKKSVFRRVLGGSAMGDRLVCIGSPATHIVYL